MKAFKHDILNQMLNSIINFFLITDEIQNDTQLKETFSSKIILIFGAFILFFTIIGHFLFFPKIYQFTIKDTEEYNSKLREINATVIGFTSDKTSRSGSICSKPIVSYEIHNKVYEVELEKCQSELGFIENREYQVYYNIDNPKYGSYEKSKVLNKYETAAILYLVYFIFIFVFLGFFHLIFLKKKEKTNSPAANGIEPTNLNSPQKKQGMFVGCIQALLILSLIYLGGSLIMEIPHLNKVKTDAEVISFNMQNNIIDGANIKFIDNQTGKENYSDIKLGKNIEDIKLNQKIKIMYSKNDSHNVYLDSSLSFTWYVILILVPILCSIILLINKIFK